MTRKDSLTNLLHIFVLSSFAIAQPLLDILAHNTDFFVAMASRPVDIISLVIFVCILIPLFLFLLELLAFRFSMSAGKWMHFALVALLIAILSLQVLKQVSWITGSLNILLSATSGCLLSLTLSKVSAARFALTYLSPLAAIVPILFFNNVAVRHVMEAKKEPTPVSLSAVSDTPLVFLILDQLPVTALMNEAGHIDANRFPNFARLAERSNWYRNTVTSNTATTISLATILTGQYPAGKETATWRDHPNNLFILLGGQYEMNVFEFATEMCPPSLLQRVRIKTYPQRISHLLQDASAVFLQIVLPAEYAVRFPSVSETIGNFWNEGKTDKDNRVAQFQNFLSNIQNTDKPLLHFLHLNLPHNPMQYLASGKEYIDFGVTDWGYSRERGGRWQKEEWLTLVAEHQYLLQTRAVDRLVGKLLDRLEQTGLFDRSLIIVTSDHGVSFWPGESNRITESQNVQDLLYVPLFMKMPFQKTGSILDRQTETVDILPGIADALKIQLPWNVDGISVFKNPDRTSASSNNGIHLGHPSMQRRWYYFNGTESFSVVKSNLLGLNLNDLAISGTSEFEIQMMKPELFRSVNTKSTFIPAMIAGFVHPAVEKKMTVAIAVNGIVRAITYTFPLHRERLRFAAIVPEDSFRDGQNQVDVLFVSEDGTVLSRPRRIR